jgi:phage terminase large subunit
VKLTEKQAEALKLMGRKEVKHVLLYGGAQSAKTYAGLYAVLVRALAAPDSVHAICRLRLVDLRSAILLTKFPEVVKHRFGEEVSENKDLFHYVYSYPSYIRLSNNAKIFFLGLEDNRGFDKILSPSYSTVMIDEASEVPYGAYSKLLTRLSQKNRLKKVSICTLNPTTKRHWTYQLFFDGKNPVDNKDVAAIRTYAKLQMNPIDNLDNLPDDYIELLESLPEQDKERFLYGRYSENLENVIFGEQIKVAQSEERFRDDLKEDPELPFYAVFDIGMHDATACWIVQFARVEIRFLAYKEWTHTPITAIFKEWINCFKFKISGVYLPHDANNKWVGDGRSVKQLLELYAMRLPEDKKFFISVLKKFERKWQAIHMSRVYFKRCYFNAKECADGIESLREYKYEQDETLGVYKNEPRHDWASHGADAFMYTIQAWQYLEKQPEEESRDPNKIYFDDLINHREGYV